jgi:hypothetical protein
MSTISVHDLPPVELTIDGIAFDRYHYDAVADTLCFHTGPAEWAVDFDETIEEHLLRFNADERLLSLTILNARWHLDQESAIDVTLHDRGPTTQLSRELVEPLLRDTLRYA